MEGYIMSKDKSIKNDKRFKVEIPFSVCEIDSDGKETPFFDCKLEYHDVPYDGVVGIQSCMVELLQRLNQVGFETVKAMGLEDKLKVFMGKNSS